MKKTFRIAFCGIIAALGVIVMFLTGLIPVATLALPAIAGCLLIAVVVETNVRWGFAVYAVTSIFAMLLTPDRQAAVCYILFFGYYPVLFAILGRIKQSLLRYIIKFLIFNAAVAGVGAISIFALGIPLDLALPFGWISYVFIFVLLNIMFLVYDFALNGLILFYMNRFHDKLGRFLKK